MTNKVTLNDLVEGSLQGAYVLVGDPTENKIKKVPAGQINLGVSGSKVSYSLAKYTEVVGEDGKVTRNLDMKPLTAGNLLEVSEELDGVKVSLGSALTDLPDKVASFDGRVTAVEQGLVTVDTKINSLEIGLHGGDFWVSEKCIGNAPRVFTSSISAEQSDGCNTLIGNPSTGASINCAIGDIAPYNSIDLTIGQRREGNNITVANISSGTVIVTLPIDVKIQVRTILQSTLSVTQGTTVILHPTISPTGVKAYILIAKYPNR